jgi:hypothetical protein
MRGILDMREGWEVSTTASTINDKRQIANWRSGFLAGAKTSVNVTNERYDRDRRHRSGKHADYASMVTGIRWISLRPDLGNGRGKGCAMPLASNARQHSSYGPTPCAVSNVAQCAIV